MWDAMKCVSDSHLKRNYLQLLHGQIVLNHRVLRFPKADVGE